MATADNSDKREDCQCVSQWEYLTIAREKGQDGKSILEKSKPQPKPIEWIANEVRLELKV